MPPFRVDLPAMVNAITGMAATTPKIHSRARSPWRSLFFAITVLPFELWV